MINKVWDNVNLAAEVFRSIIVTTNQKIIDDEIIGWENYTPGIFKNLYAKEYEIITRNRQYSFLLNNDKGCIQLYYQFDKGTLLKAKLAYYPFPIELRETPHEIERYIDDYDNELIGEYYFDVLNLLTHQFDLTTVDESLQQLIKEAKNVGNDETPENLILGRFEAKYKFTNSSHFRIDYDPKVTTHHKCEIQVGAINSLRLPMQKLISPFTFMDFIARNIFPVEYKKIVEHRDFPTNFNISKKNSHTIDPFKEDNIFTSHL